jgi:hypothetical protein
MAKSSMSVAQGDQRDMVSEVAPSTKQGSLPPDPFDPASLRLGQDFVSSIGVKKVLTVVRCRKPSRQEFVRVRPGVEWRLETAVYEDKVQRETYLVDRGFQASPATH